MSKRKVGYVALIGRPNSGKSTFINTLLDEKVSIVSKLPQTTQKTLRGVYTDPDCQIIFFDPAGINKSEKFWNQELNTRAIKAMDDADIVFHFVDCSRADGEEEAYIGELLTKVDKPVIHILTKVDTLDKRARTQLDPKYMESSCLWISSETKEGFPDVIEKAIELLPEGELLYPEDMYTDQDVFTRVTEIVREKIFLHFSQEVPHSIHSEVVEYKESEDKSMRTFHLEIYCETSSQKKILIGKNGDAIKKIGTEARKELEALFEQKVFLGLRIKVKKNWRSSKSIVQDLLN